MQDAKAHIQKSLKDVKLFLATPCYGGQCTNYYLSSMYYLSRALCDIELYNILATSANESLITRARNRLVRLFLDTDCTHLMFIDADIHFNPLDVVRLLMHNKDVVCGSYPKKGLALDRLIGANITNIEAADRIIYSHVVNLRHDDQDKINGSKGPVKINTEDGLVEVMDAGTGFMCIKREVILDIIKHYQNIKYTSEEDGRDWYAVFDCVIENDRYLSEDYAFCRRWQNLGGRVWMDPDIILDHVGTHVYKGTPQFFWGENNDIKTKLN